MTSINMAVMENSHETLLLPWDELSQSMFGEELNPETFPMFPNIFCYD